MKNRKFLCLWALLMAASFVLSGCVTTVDQMYRLPRRSERYENLQTQIDAAMSGMRYSAPVSGENRQTVQMADLDGDGLSEIVAFVKGEDADPLKILIFTPVNEGFELRHTLESTGMAFDQEEYAQMDGQPGLELIVGRQVGDQVLRNVSVYSFDGGSQRMLLSTNYQKMLTCDLDVDGATDLFLIHPGQQEGEAAFAALYSVHGGEVNRSAEAELSVGAENLKRIITGTLDSGESAVYVASKAGEEAILTDVFALVDGNLKNVTLSSEVGTSVQTLRNYYVYADDIDSDGVVELPELITMVQPMARSGGSQHLIRWYSLRSDGSTVTKGYTYHNYLDGWYVELDEAYARDIWVDIDSSGGYRFHLYDESAGTSMLLFSLYTITGEQRMNVVQQEELQELLKTDNVVFAATMAEDSPIGIDHLRQHFHLIQIYWNTGEM